ncbi:hypothetical protein [Azohydromonas sediminis]|uniref:hypothetical protein n=1 Tax=Azohydromonas sediminis TaxID=2259674 RepID=UPI0013C2B288|nr:hypothetical protein [Azohydromonas sediminis]
MTAAVLAALLTSTSAFAHHPAESIVDYLIWPMIDENVADTPHATLDFSSMGR